MNDANDATGGVVVTIATYQRPGMLARCLESLRDQDFTERFEVVVVDNDPGASAKEVAMASEGISVIYAVEPSPGIAAARNRCVEIALTFDPVWIAFIDDDEWADPTWLSNLILTAQDERADGSQGWVRSVYGAETPHWVRELGFGNRKSSDRGARLDTAATNNLLLRAELLAGLCPPFDPDLGLVGVDDTKLTARLVRDGASIVAAPGAVVFEEVPLERQSLEWMCRRTRRGAAGWVHIERTVLKSPWWRTRRVISCVGSCVRGGAVMCWGLVTSDEVRVARGRIYLSRAWGTVIGLADRHVQEYAR